MSRSRPFRDELPVPTLADEMAVALRARGRDVIRATIEGSCSLGQSAIAR